MKNILRPLLLLCTLLIYVGQIEASPHGGSKRADYDPGSSSSSSSTSSSTMSGSMTTSTSTESPTTTSGNSTYRSSGTGNNFAGSNLYYAAGLSADQRKTYLSALQSADMKVLRVWLDGHSSGQIKGTTITGYSSLEPDTPGTYIDDVLELYDEFMIDANAYGIKLQICIHSFNSLQAGSDAYGKKWSISNFYTDSSAQSAFDNRIEYVISHQHKTLGKPWSELSEYIFAFEAQNEAMIGDGQDFIKEHADWQCERAKVMKSAIGNNDILVSTGGESWLDESMQDAYLQCDDIDIVAIHMYGTGDFDASRLQDYVEKAQAANKMLVLQEWGVCYHQDSSNLCKTEGGSEDPNRNSIIEKFAGTVTDAGIPWLYWQVLPNADPHYDGDFEIGIVDDNSWDTLKQVSQAASAADGAFGFSGYLLSAGGNSTNSDGGDNDDEGENNVSVVVNQNGTANNDGLRQCKKRRMLE